MKKEEHLVSIEATEKEWQEIRRVLERAVSNLRISSEQTETCLKFLQTVQGESSEAINRALSGRAAEAVQSYNPGANAATKNWD